MKGVIKAGLNPQKTCARCRESFGWLFNKGSVCPKCQHKVCDKCRQVVTKKTSRGWVCILCFKQMYDIWFLPLQNVLNFCFVTSVICFCFCFVDGGIFIVIVRCDGTEHFAKSNESTCHRFCAKTGDQLFVCKVQKCPHLTKKSILQPNERTPSEKLKSTQKFLTCSLASLSRELEAQTNKWFYSQFRKSKRSKKTSNVITGSEIVRASLKRAHGDGKSPRYLCLETEISRVLYAATTVPFGV